MEQQSKGSNLPLRGMCIVTVLVMCILGVFVWWAGHRDDVYLLRAERAAERGNWERAFSLAEQAQQAGKNEAVTAITYANAKTLYDCGEYEAAREIFLGLPEYEDAEAQVLACSYQMAVLAQEAGDLETAQAGFLAAVGYADALERYDACRYAVAEQHLAAGDVRIAFYQFLDLGEYADAPKRARALAVALTGEEDEELALLYAQGNSEGDWEKQAQLAQRREDLSNQRLAAGRRHVAVLNEDGRVLTAGDNRFGQCETEAWENVIAVSAGYAHTLALTADGRVLAAGDNSHGQCEVEAWESVVSILCGPWDSYALCKDGTVLHCGFSELSALSGWTNVAALGAGDGALFAVRQDGSLLAALSGEAKSWRALCAVDAVNRTPVALKMDGTLLSDVYDLSAWTDIVALDASSTLLVGLHEDGTLRAVSLMPAGESLLEALLSETDVVGLSVAGTYALLLHADGTLCAPGASEDVQAFCAAHNEKQ